MKNRSLVGLTFTIFILVACCFVLPSTAKAVVVLDFDSPSISIWDPNQGWLWDDYFEDGFRISIPSTLHRALGIIDGDFDFFISTYDNHNPIARFDRFGIPFDFLSVDIASFILDSQGPFKGGKGPSDEIFYVTSSKGGYFEVDSTGGKIFSGSDWNDITWVEFSILDTRYDTDEDQLRIDNIVLRAPEPSTILLLSTGLVALAGLNIKKR